MLIKIDWISFSVPIDLKGVDDDRDIPAAVSSACSDLHKDLPEWLGFSGEWEAGKGRAPYSVGWKRIVPGVTVYGNSRVPHALIEVSGSGCDGLATDSSLLLVLGAVQTRLTRIDIACDIATDTQPLEFAELRDVKRFKAHSYVYSESGSTYYVGAKTSDRYCRVYRWSEPHPRHRLLRVEYVVKAENAKITARTILETGLPPVAANLGACFGWKHGEWKLDDESAEMAVYRPDRRTGKTVYWLGDTIAPLLARLQDEGVINIDTWVREQVYPLLKTKA